MAKVAEVVGGVALIGAGLLLGPANFITGTLGYQLIGATGASVLFGIGSSIALRGVSEALTKPAVSKGLAGRAVTARQAIAPRRIIYGALRFGGEVTFLI